MAATAGICEDDDELRGFVRTALERAGYVVRATATGGDALRVFGGDPPDVLILDVGLPDADGRDICQALPARGVTTPVLFLTARSMLVDHVIVMVIQAGRAGWPSPGAPRVRTGALRRSATPARRHSPRPIASSRCCTARMTASRPR